MKNPLLILQDELVRHLGYHNASLFLFEPPRPFLQVQTYCQLHLDQNRTLDLCTDFHLDLLSKDLLPYQYKADGAYQQFAQPPLPKKDDLEEPFHHSLVFYQLILLLQLANFYPFHGLYFQLSYSLFSPTEVNSR